MPLFRFCPFLRPLVLILLSVAALEAQVSITVASNPAGQAFTLSGVGCSPGGYTTPQTLSWVPGSSCTIAFPPQYLQLGAETVFNVWQDGQTFNPRTFTAPAQAATYTATFNYQYFLTVLANPAGGGTVSGGGWFAANITATVTATPAGGYHLVDWVGANAIAGSTSATVKMTGPLTATANFAPTPPTTNYTVTSIFTRSGTYPTNQGLINSFGQVVAITGAGSSGFPLAYPTYSVLWTPAAANGTTGTSIDLGHLPAGAAFTNIATGINDWGQVVGTTSDFTGGHTTQAFLWTPTVANGTSGAILPFLGAAGAGSSTAAGINGVGQIVGSMAGSSFIWTPSSPHGTTGTLNTDSRLSGLAGINDFGQVILNSTALSQASQPILFTPSSPNSATGSYTQIPAPGGGNNNVLVAINKNGAVLGASSGSQGTQGFLWTPTLPNVTTGQTTVIPIPNGFVSLIPTAFNSTGQVVGTMTTSAGVPTPFLYTGGTVYDLTTVSSQLVQGVPVGINDRGQIVINSGISADVYLLTPLSLSAPAPVSASPQSGSTASQTFVFSFSDPRGWQDLDVVNILINNFIDGRGACYLAYSVPSSTLYLVNDAGLAGGPYAGSVALGNSAAIQNSQCMVSLTSASGNGNTLTLTVNATFQTAFGGNKILYVAARDQEQDNSGWVPMGVWQVPGAAPSTTTAVVGMTPASGAGFGPTAYTFNFTDTKGYKDLGVADILVNSVLNGRHACYIAYSRPNNVLYLLNDNGDGLLSGGLLSVGGNISNSQCAVSWGNNAVSAGGNNLSLSLNIGFSPGFGPNLVFYLATRDVNEANNTDWQSKATWSAQ